jgi:hypothetical protein
VEANRVTLQAETELLELEKDRTKELEKQAQLAADIVREASRDTTGALGDRQGELRNQQLIGQFGQKDADFIRRVEDLVINKGVPFSEAFKLEEAVDNQQKLNEAAAQTQGLYEQIGSTIATGITDAITGAINGTKDLNEVLSDVLGSIGQLLINSGVQSALGGIGIPLPGRASGGPVAGGSTYLVGEKGPELFVPRQSGEIISNADSITQSAMQRYNRAATANNGGTLDPSVSGNTIDPSINISTGPVLNFEGSQYVRREDFEAGLMKAAAEGGKQGETRTLSRLKNSRASRSRLGL